jgi:cytochrome c oxidase assembly protein subunit 15
MAFAAVPAYLGDDAPRPAHDGPMMSTTTVDHTPTSAPAHGVTDAGAARRVAGWLLFTAAMVFAMAVIGAITRLTESGLSMVEWRPLIGTLPPLSDAEWQRVFDLYRQTPEYRFINAGMSLAEFKEIFFWEWLHRLWGRLIGLVFVLPLVWFWLRGTLSRIGHVQNLRWKLVGLLALGGLQGVMGWVMVQSGLVDRPSVSQYRLAAHLGLAFVIFSLLIWMALRLLRPARADQPAGLAGVRRHGWWTLGLVGVTVFWGALVAGLDAGLAYNSWPLMGGAILPPEAFSIAPAWLNAFENTALVQFIHRWLAILAALAALALGLRALSAGADGPARPLAWALMAMVLVQVGLGIATLLLAVPIWLGALHQAGALILVGLLVWWLFEAGPDRRARPPLPGRAQ